MKTRKLKDENQLRECLKERDKTRLSQQTAFLKEVRKHMDDARYTDNEKANVDLVLKISQEILDGETPTLSDVQKLQAKIIAYIGPNFMFLPNFATTQPKEFYVDDRCGNMRKAKKEVLKAVKELAELNESPPETPSFHNCGMW